MKSLAKTQKVRINFLELTKLAESLLQSEKCFTKEIHLNLRENSKFELF